MGTIAVLKKLAAAGAAVAAKSAPPCATKITPVIAHRSAAVLVLFMPSLLAPEYQTRLGKAIRFLM